MAPNTIEDLIDELGAGFADAVRPLVQGVAADADVDGFGRRLAQVALDAARAGDPKLVRMTKNQLWWFLETHRLRLVHAEYSALGSVLDVGFKTASVLLKYIPAPFGGLAAAALDALTTPDQPTS